MCVITKHFRRAAGVAKNGDTSEASRHYRIGAIGIRKDGAIVAASNIATRLQEPLAHAEARLCKKLDRGAIVYVVRIRRNGQLAIARPCRSCRTIMRARGVKKCYYSINDNEYGVIYF